MNSAGGGRRSVLRGTGLRGLRLCVTWAGLAGSKGSSVLSCSGAARQPSRALHHELTFPAAILAGVKCFSVALLTSEDTDLFQETRWPALESPPLPDAPSPESPLVLVASLLLPQLPLKPRSLS